MPELVLTYPRVVIFGWGSLQKLPEQARLLGRRPLLVTGRGWLRASGRLDGIVGDLRAAGLDPALFEGVAPEPTVTTAQRGIELARAERCDSVIAVGGGSVIDVGKTIAAIAPLEGTAEEYFLGQREIPRPGWPMLAAPTTAGTGAEATKNSVLRDPARKLKASLRSPHMMPTVALVDPELTVALPPQATAYSGLDAFAQAIESYVSVGASAFTEGQSRRAAGLIGRSLLKAYSNGADREAREAVSLGSLLAGIALNNARLGLVHGLAHPLGVRYNLPHGLVCALLLPAVIAFNREAVAESYSDLEKELGIEAGALEEFAQHLNRELGIPSRLSALGANWDAAELEAIIDEILVSGSTKSNPRPATRGDIRALLGQLA